VLGNPENERKCIFYLDTKPEVKKEAANQIRHENIELIRKNNKLERSLPQNENQSRNILWRDAAIHFGSVGKK